MASKKKNKAKTAPAKKTRSEMHYVWIGIGIVVLLGILVLVLRAQGKKAEWEASHGRTTYEKLLTAYFDATESGDEEDIEILYRTEITAIYMLVDSNKEEEDSKSFLEYGDVLYKYYGMDVVSWDIVSESDKAASDYEYLEQYFQIAPETVKDLTVNVVFDDGKQTYDVSTVISVMLVEGRWYMNDTWEVEA